MAQKVIAGSLCHIVVRITNFALEVTTCTCMSINLVQAQYEFNFHTMMSWSFHIFLRNRPTLVDVMPLTDRRTK